MGNIIDYLKEYGAKSFEEVPFGEADVLLLAQLSYLKFDGIVPTIAQHSEGITLEEIDRRMDPALVFADTVIQMDNYMPVDITAKVRELCRDYPLNENTAAGFKAPQSHRIMSKNTPLNGSKKDYYGHFKVQDKPERLKVKVHGRDGFSIGKQEVDLRYVEQLIDSEQTGALGALLKYAVEKLIDGKRTLPEIVELLCNKLEKEGLSFLSEGYTSCGYAVPRRQEIYACFNRYRRP